VPGGGHYYGGWNLSEVIGSERPATDEGTHQLPLGKSTMLFAGGADHPVSPFHLDHFGLDSLCMSSTKLSTTKLSTFFDDIHDLSPRELACKLSDTRGVFISESSVYRILKSRGLITTPNHILLSASDSFEKKTQFVHEMWQTDFTYFKIIGWGWYYLSTIIDDYSRYIVHWELCSTMKAENVQSTIAQALIKAELKTSQRPVLLSDNGACYVSSELKDYLSTVNIKSIHGKVMHPQTQGKIERYHRSMKNVVKLENYYHPEQLIDAIQDFVEYYNHERYHESLQNVTPSDVYYGRQEQILQKRALIKQQSLKRRKQLFLKEKILHLNNETLYN